jgi:hypothetical protein
MTSTHRSQLRWLENRHHVRNPTMRRRLTVVTVAAGLLAPGSGRLCRSAPDVMARGGRARVRPEGRPQATRFSKAPQPRS